MTPDWLKKDKRTTLDINKPVEVPDPKVPLPDKSEKGPTPCAAAEPLRS